MRPRSGLSVVRPDWLVDALWPGCEAQVVASVGRGRAALAHDVFGWLLLAEPALCPRGSRDDPARARRVQALASDVRVRAVRSLTVGDEGACAEWVPRIVASLAESAGDDRATADGEGVGDAAEARADPGAGDLFDADGGRAGAGGGPDARATDDDLVALLDVDDRATLRRLVEACRRGLRAHDGFGDAVRATASADDRTRDPGRFAGTVWQSFAARDTETLFWRDWACTGVRGAVPTETSAAPLVVLCDESGSMQLLLDAAHTRRAWALAAVIACAEMTDGRRDMVYVGFAGAGACWHQPLPAADRRARARGLRRVCAHLFGGGTSFEDPIATALPMLRPGARVLVLSDGEGAFDDPALAERWRAGLVASGARCWGVRIGGDDDETPLDALCHAVVRLDDFAGAHLDARYPSLARARAGAGE